MKGGTTVNLFFRETEALAAINAALRNARSRFATRGFQTKTPLLNAAKNPWALHGRAHHLFWEAPLGKHCAVDHVARACA